jgi:hypothetical protein
MHVPVTADQLLAVLDVVQVTVGTPAGPAV